MARHRSRTLRQLLADAVTQEILNCNSNYWDARKTSCQTNYHAPAFVSVFQFSVLARQWRRTLDKSFEEAGLTDATWAPLLHLQETGDGISQKDLAVLVGIDGSSLVRLLDILAHKGLIERQIDKDDRRARLIFLTKAGRNAVKEIVCSSPRRKRRCCPT